MVQTVSFTFNVSATEAVAVTELQLVGMKKAEIEKTCEKLLEFPFVCASLEFSSALISCSSVRNMAEFPQVLKGIVFFG